MGKALKGTATDAIEFGQHVIVRGYDVSPAEPCVANAVARSKPAWTQQTSYEAGDFVLCDPIEGLGERDLHKLAELPIMDPIRLNLPAGKISEDEYQERLDLQFREAGISRA